MNTIHWKAIYNDGTEFVQYEGDIKRAYEHIDRSRLVAFSVYRNNYQQKILTFHLEPGQRLIYRQRILQRLGSAPIEVYIVGWQQSIAGSNVQSIAYILPDGRIEIAGQWKENHAIFGAVILSDDEK